MFGGMSGKCLGDLVVMVSVVDVVDQDLGLSSRTFLTYFDLMYSVEAQLDYWREDPMLHAFHCILHSAWSQFPI